MLSGIFRSIKRHSIEQNKNPRVAEDCSGFGPVHAYVLDDAPDGEQVIDIITVYDDLEPGLNGQTHLDEVKAVEIEVNNQGVPSQNHFRFHVCLVGNDLDDRQPRGKVILRCSCEENMLLVGHGLRPMARVLVPDRAHPGSSRHPERCHRGRRT